MRETERLAVMGVPRWHPMVIEMEQMHAATRSYAADITGRGISVEPYRKVLERGLELAGLENTARLRVGFMYAGISFPAVAFDLARGSWWEYAFAIECDAHVATLHQRIWGEKCRLLLQRVEDDEVMMAPEVEVLTAAPPCTPYTPKNEKRGSEENKSRSEEEVETLLKALRYLEARRPKLVIIENVTGIESKGGVAARAFEKAMIDACEDYVWFKQTVAPNGHCKLPNRRDRIFWVGVLAPRGTGEGGSEDGTSGGEEEGEEGTGGA